MTTDTETNVLWSNELGTRMIDLLYGNGESNKFDLYLSADSRKINYCLADCLRAGGNRKLYQPRLWLRCRSCKLNDNYYPE